MNRRFACPDCGRVVDVDDQALDDQLGYVAELLMGRPLDDREADQLAAELHPDPECCGWQMVELIFGAR